MSAGEAISGPNRPEGYIADNRLLIWISVSAPQVDGLTPAVSPPPGGRRVEGSPQRLGRWPDRVAAPQRTHSTTTWTHPPADAYPGLRGPVGSSRSSAPALTRLPPHPRDLATTQLQLDRSRRTCRPGQVDIPDSETGLPSRTGPTPTIHPVDGPLPHKATSSHEGPGLDPAAT